MSEPKPKPHVLAVDDEEHITELVAMALGIHGFEVERASGNIDAAEAALAESNRLAHAQGALMFVSKGT